MLAIVRKATKFYIAPKYALTVMDESKYPKKERADIEKLFYYIDNALVVQPIVYSDGAILYKHRPIVYVLNIYIYI